VVSASPDPAHVTMPRVHNIAALLKRWLLGTHQGGVQHVHLDYYLDEFAFRFNRRRSKARGLLFHRLACQAVAIGPATYDAIAQHRCGTTRQLPETSWGNQPQGQGHWRPPYREANIKADWSEADTLFAAKSPTFR
jgi:hypothetical protein